MSSSLMISTNHEFKNIFSTARGKKYARTKLQLIYNCHFFVFLGTTTSFNIQRKIKDIGSNKRGYLTIYYYHYYYYYLMFRIVPQPH